MNQSTCMYKSFFLFCEFFRKKNLCLLCIIFLMSPGFSFARIPEKQVADRCIWENATDTSDYFNRDFFRCENYVYVPNISTVQFHPPDAGLSPPIIRLNSQDVLQFSFDDLDADVKSYHYKIIHCTFEWKPTDIVESQYQKGYSDDQISDSRYSFNTQRRYTHYQFNFPNENIQPVISGNFLLIVFRDYNLDKIVITRRFMVLDPKVIITPNVHRATAIIDRKSKQEVDFSVFHNNYKIDNPFTDLKVAVYQNDRTDNVITNLKPLFLKDNELDYDYEEGNVFNGGNEFRYFDTRSLRTQTERVKKIVNDSTGCHVFLVDDLKRSYQIYTTDQDINGAFIIKTYDGKTDALEADYCWVHFRLPVESPFVNANIYVFGSFTDWSFNSKTKMVYNEEEQAYEVSVFVKQGYYNYEYVSVEDGFEYANETEIEGNHSETENNYMIYVYNRQVINRYDELIGLKRFNSLTN